MAFFSIKWVKIACIFMAVILCSGYAAAGFHQHEDSLFHEDCLLCRFQITGNLSDLSEGPSPLHVGVMTEGIVTIYYTLHCVPSIYLPYNSNAPPFFS